MPVVHPPSRRIADAELQASRCQIGESQCDVNSTRSALQCYYALGYECQAASCPPVRSLFVYLHPRPRMRSPSCCITRTNSRAAPKQPLTESWAAPPAPCGRMGPPSSHVATCKAKTCRPDDKKTHSSPQTATHMAVHARALVLF